MSLDVLLARQAGVISRGQALRCGVTAAGVERRVRSRRWHPLHPCVYLVRGHRADDEARARAALLWAGDGAVLAGVAAAWWHGLLAAAPEALPVAMPLPKPTRPGIAVRRRMPAAADRTRRRGLPVTALGLTVLESAVEVGGTDGALLLDRAVEGGVGWPELLAAHGRNPIAAAGPLLAAAASRSAAAAEVLLVRLLFRSGLRGWHRLPAAAGRPASVVFPAARVTVEVVGWSPASAGRTPRPHAQADPWRTLRFGRSELSSCPRAVLAAIAAAVDGVICTTRTAGSGCPRAI